ncbi:MAG: argininosuccinate lyase, partial [Pyrinomonadaceae bacterium]|nr:argininosuccinate lyase [Pyrinomonadaceae bacterium]
MEDQKNLWGGRFTSPTDETFTEFNRSFTFDCRLFAADIVASIAHANGLGRAGVLTEDEAAAIVRGLEGLAEKAGLEQDYFDDDAAEDVHSFIEAHLVAEIGDTGKKLHTGRSRNDQVATAFRLWLRAETDSVIEELRVLERALIAAAERHADAVLPGYTHLQRAQPVMWAHWCLAYVEMFSRDRERFVQARGRLNTMPLGSAALAGTAFPIDREAVAKELGFEGVSRNSLDAVSDRDFAVEFAAASSLAMVHLSRLAEDLIL